MAGRKETVADLATSNNHRLAADAAVTSAQARLVTAEEEYRDVRNRALSSGWTNAELKRLGYPPVRQRRRGKDDAKNAATQTPSEEQRSTAVEAGSDEGSAES